MDATLRNRRRRLRSRLAIKAVGTQILHCAKGLDVSQFDAQAKQKFVEQVERSIRFKFASTAFFIALLLKLLPILIDLFFADPDGFSESVERLPAELVKCVETIETEDGVRKVATQLSESVEFRPSDFMRVIAAILMILADFYDWWNHESRGSVL